MKRIILVSTIILCILLAGCQKIVEEETFEVTAVVAEKEYKSSYTTYTPMRVGKVTMMSPQFHPAKYNVTIVYEDMAQTFNNQALYEKVSKGDTITVILYHGYNEDRELVKKELLLPG